MYPIQLFEYRSKPVRTVDVNGETWIVAKDVCDILGLSHVSNATAELDDDEKLSVKILQSGQHRKMITVNKPGVYMLIFRSKKKEAKPFKRWLAHEVIPQIEKTGSYMPENAMLQIMNKVFDFVDKRLELLEKKLMQQNNNKCLMGVTQIPDSVYRSELVKRIKAYADIHCNDPERFERYWNTFYYHFEQRFHFNPNIRAKALIKQGAHSKTNGLDVITRKGLMRKANELAIQLFPLPDKLAIAS